MKNIQALVKVGVLLTLALTVTLISSCSKPNNSEAVSNGPTSFFGNMTQSRAATVEQDKPLQLPQDHKNHPDFQLEWWYLTFVLEDEKQNAYGMQFTLFRFRNNGKEPTAQYESDWSDTQQWMGHASLHSAEAHFFEERFAAGGVGNACVNTSPFEAIIDDWYWKAVGDRGALFPSTLSVSLTSMASSEPTTSANAILELNADGPFIKQGDNGYSKKTGDERLRSYYYSQPFIKANGTLTIEDKTMSVSGLGWYDHEWTSHLANSQAMGWDWFSIHFDNGEKLMAFRMHAQNDDIQQKSRMSEIFTTASFIQKDGTKETLSGEAITITPIRISSIDTENGIRKVPTAWTIAIPSKNISVTTSPFKENQWNSSVFPYYEGRIEVSGSHSGAGFMELTGY